MNLPTDATQSPPRQVAATKLPKLPNTPADTALNWLSWGGASAWVLMILGAISGAGLAMQTVDLGYGGEDHPYIGTGIGVVISSVLIGVIVLSVLNFMIWRVKTAPISR